MVESQMPVSTCSPGVGGRRRGARRSIGASAQAGGGGAARAGQPHAQPTSVVRRACRDVTCCNYYSNYSESPFFTQFYGPRSRGP